VQTFQPIKPPKPRGAVLAGALCLSLTAAAHAAPTPKSAEARLTAIWRAAITSLAVPGQGCFTADYPAAALALGATIVTNKREIAAADYFKGLFETALADDEIITKVKFPVPEKSGYEKFRNPASRYAMVGVFVAKTKAGVRVAVTGAGSSGVFRHSAMEAALTANFAPQSVAGVKTEASGLLSDLHGDAEYRAHLVGVMARRAVEAAA